MKAQTVRLKSIKIIFRDYKHFDEQIFLEDLPLLNSYETVIVQMKTTMI